MSDKNMIALAEIRNGYVLNKYGNLTLEQNSLIKYDNLCLNLIKENQELKKQLEYHTPDENIGYFKGKNESKMKINRLRSENKELKEENQTLKKQLEEKQIH